MDVKATTYVLSPAQPSGAPTPPWLKRAGDRLQAAYQDYLEECKEHAVETQPFDIAFRLVASLHPAAPYELRLVQPATAPVDVKKDPHAKELDNPGRLPQDAAANEVPGPSSRGKTLRSFTRRDSQSSSLSWTAARWPKGGQSHESGSLSDVKHTNKTQ